VSGLQATESSSLPIFRSKKSVVGDGAVAFRGV
jgi:hypothetical protein